MANLHPTAWVAPGAYLRGDVTLGEQTNVWYNAVLRADQEKITIGAFSNVQDNCVLHGDAGNHVTVGDHVTVGHGAILHGCTVEDKCLIGMNSVILDHAVIGKGSIVGAGPLLRRGPSCRPEAWWSASPPRSKRPSRTRTWQAASPTPTATWAS